MACSQVCQHEPRVLHVASEAGSPARWRRVPPRHVLSFSSFGLTAIPAAGWRQTRTLALRPPIPSLTATAFMAWRGSNSNNRRPAAAWALNSRVLPKLPLRPFPPYSDHGGLFSLTDRNTPQWPLGPFRLVQVSVKLDGPCQFAALPSSLSPTRGPWARDQLQLRIGANPSAPI